MRFQKQLFRAVLGVFGALLVASALEVAARVAGNKALYPGVLDIYRALVEWYVRGELFGDVVESVPRAILSIIIATPLGFFIGTFLGLSRVGRFVFEPCVHFFRALPPVALLPLFVLWFGIAWSDKLFVSVFVCIFPVIVVTMQSVQILDEKYSELRRDYSLNVSDYTTLVIIPGVLPFVVPSVRLASGTAFIMLFVSELAGASSGLGYRISVSQLAFRADEMLAALLVLGGIAIIVDTVIQLVSKTVFTYASK
jgi:sulfonate transport system permease protein